MAVYEAIGSEVSGAKYYTLRLTVNEDGYSIPNNTSGVSWALDLISSNGYSFSSWSFPITASVDGEVYNENISRSIAKNGTLRIASGSKQIEHNSDGKKTINVGATVRATGAYYLPGNIDISGILTLTTIPRKTILYVSDGIIGDSNNKPVFTFDRKANVFTHTISFVDGGGTERTIATGLNTNTYNSWTIPTSFYQYMVTQKSYYTTFYCYTYNGGTLIGTDTAHAYVKVDETSNKPTLSTLSITDNTPSGKYITAPSTLTGSSSILIKGISYVKATITATPKNSAYIKRISCTGESDYTGTATGAITFNKTSTSPVSATSFTASATDSRDISNTISPVTPTMKDYTPLTLNVDLARPNATSTSINITLNGNFYATQFSSSKTNALTLVSLKYREKSVSTWTTLSPSAFTTSYNKNQKTFTSKYTLTGTQYNKDYEFSFTVQDLLLQKSVSISLTSAVPIHDEGIDANGNNYFNVNGGYYKNNIPLIECGTNYIKYADGTMVYHKTRTWTGVINNTWGNLYISPDIIINNYEVPFVGNIPTVNIFITSDGYSAWANNIGKGSLTAPPRNKHSKGNSYKYFNKLLHQYHSDRKVEIMTDEQKIRLYGSIEEYEKFIAQKYLNDTDYIIIKIQEYQITGQELTDDYTEILKKREEAREVIRGLKNA